MDEPIALKPAEGGAVKTDRQELAMLVGAVYAIGRFGKRLIGRGR